MRRQRIFIRNFQAGAYLQSLLVAAVASVLVIRLFLRITGYPQIGGGGLHIAHMLWGGLLMLASIVVLLSFLGRAAERAAAILGGVGFGTFIDEVGKFVTSDHNYFFQPAVALIYVMFILLFLTFRALHTGRNYSRREYLVNALQEMEEVAVRDLDQEEKNRAFQLLEKSNARNPLVAALRDSLARANLRPSTEPGVVTRLELGIRDFYYHIAGLSWFSLAVVIFFAGQLLIKLLYVFILVFILGLGWAQILDFRLVGRIAGRMQNLSFIDGAEIAFSLLSGLFVAWGVLKIRRSRLQAFKAFERSILISIFLTQVFAFYKEQFSALLGLILNILILVTLRFMIEREESAAAHAERPLQSANHPA